MAVPNIFGTATAAIPLSQLDTNFATAITLGNTAVYLGNTTTSLGNVTLTNVTISSGNVTVTGANVSGTANVSTLIITGNQTSLGNVSITGNISANIATFGAGSNTAPSITTTGDTNTGIFFPAADTIAFSEGGAEAMRIDSSGQLLVGTTTALAKTTIYKAGSGLQVSSPQLTLQNDVADGASGDGAGINFANATGAVVNIGCSGNGQLFFANRASTGAGWSERMRLDSSGNLLVGGINTFTGNRLYVSGSALGGEGVLGIRSDTASDLGSPALFISKFDNNATTSQVYVRFAMFNNLLAQGQINANGASAVAFGTWSDRRLKENITDLPSQLANIMALRPVEFDYIEAEGGGHQLGFIAQEVKEIYPDLVGEREDGMLTLSDMNKNDARLIKAMQEQQAIITQLTARITALETPVVTPAEPTTGTQA